MKSDAVIKSDGECLECGNDLGFNFPDETTVDWVKVVCSECGGVDHVSILRAIQSDKKNLSKTDTKGDA